MSHLSSDLEERKKKYERLLNRKKPEEKAMSKANQFVSGNVDEIVEKLHQDKANKKREEEAKSHESKPQPIPTQKKNLNLHIESCIGEHYITEKEKYEQGVQAILVDPKQITGKRTSVNEGINDSLLPRKSTMPMKREATENKPSAEKAEHKDRELTEEEIKNLTSSKTFHDFFVKHSKLIEKALDLNIEDMDAAMEMGTIKGNEETSWEFLHFSSKFFDLNLCQNRVIVDMDVSPSVQLAINSDGRSGNGGLFSKSRRKHQ